MSDADVIRAFAEARRSEQPLKHLPEPQPPAMERAFALQTAITGELGWTQVGWKIGCTSARAQKALKANGPFPGTMYANRLYVSGEHVPTAPANKRCVEPEVAFTMAEALPFRGRHYTHAEVMAAVASVHPGIEIVNPRTPNGFADPVPWFVVDGGLNHAMVLGAAQKPMDRAAYAGLKARVVWNGREMEGGVGANALGGGDLALTWLANHLIDNDSALREGDIVTTGVITEFFFAGVGDSVEASFEGLGTVTLIF
jgi:2-oxo-3-hexenedioate decarboxylase/2-keto-4-pentenoate hydratase